MQPQTVIPLGYDADAHCEFHLGAPNHTIENFKALGHKVQDLIDAKAILFMQNGLNTNNNPMPPHVGPFVSVIDKENKMMYCMDEIRTPLATSKDQLLMNEVHPGCDKNYED